MTTASSTNAYNILKANLEDDTLLILTLQPVPGPGRTNFSFPFEITNPTDAQKAAYKKGTTLSLDIAAPAPSA